MDILFTKSFWELDLADEADPIETFARKVATDGFDGVEMFLPLLDQAPDHIVGTVKNTGLSHIVIDIITEGESPADHRSSFDDAVERAMAFSPDLINSHTGRDIFAFEDNVSLLRHALSVSADIGVPIVHETHRYRPTYSAIETRRLLDELPELQLNADLSHWMVVHESDLSDQEQNLEAALRRSRHIHARVGFEEGPQVGDPRAPEWSGHLDRHIELWERIATHCRHAGVQTLAITPEFGPAPYVPTLPFTQEPVADVWEINVAMKNILRDRLPM
ncbi:MAG: sugar phosphate isomerase/epimerase family protein [Acidimicrobiia bacterium]